MRHIPTAPRQRTIRAVWVSDKHVNGPCGGLDAADHLWCKRGLRHVCPGYHCGHDECDGE